MLASLRSWWQKTSKTLDAVIIGSLVILLALVVMIILGYIFNWPWTGLHGRTLYDWLQLLIIPAVLAVGGYLFNYTTGRTEREIASDRQQEEALQAYIDSLSELLLHEKLRQSADNDEVRIIARVRTLTVLPRLDGNRKARVLIFLYDSSLITKSNAVIELDGADFSGAYLYKAHLSEVNLGEANLSEVDLSLAHLNDAILYKADLIGANLRYADLSAANLREANLGRANLGRADLRLANLRGANLTNAHLSGADLTGANLEGAIVTTEQLDKALSLKGAIMRDGTKHAYR